MLLNAGGWEGRGRKRPGVVVRLGHSLPPEAENSLNGGYEFR
jgi:hypothetical protein